MGLIKRPNELTVKTTLSALIYGQPGMGKAQPLYCNILTPTGFKKLSDLSVGDEVMGHDGKVQKVLGIYPQGIRPVYRIMTNDSAITYCDEEHIWTVRSSTGNSRKAGFKNVTLKEMIAKGISCPLSPSVSLNVTLKHWMTICGECQKNNVLFEGYIHIYLCIDILCQWKIPNWQHV